MHQKFEAVDLNPEDPNDALIKDLITAFADKSEYLSFEENEDIDYKFSAVNFKNLFYFSELISIKEVLETAVNLKRFSIHTSNSVTLSEFENIMIKVFDSCELLEVVAFHCQTKGRKRKQMSLWIDATYSDTKDAQLETEDFMFIWEITDLDDDTKFDEELLLKDLKSIGVKTTVIRNKNDITISSENCKLMDIMNHGPILLIRDHFL